MMDSLQATDRIIEAALAVYYSVFDPVFNPEMILRAQFLFRNSLNDLILTNNDLSSTMLDSFDKQFSELRTLSIVFTGIFIALLLAISGTILFFLYKQYSSDVCLISAVCRLSHSKIQVIHKELIDFQNELKQGKSREDSGQTQSVKSSRTREETNIFISRRETAKTPREKALRKRYLKRAFWIVTVLLILIALLIMNVLLLNNRLNKIKFAQEKLYFINHIRIKMSLVSTTFRELAATNNTVFVENRETLDELELLIEQLVAIRAEIYSTLLTEEVLKGNPEVETLLLGDGCSLLSSIFGSSCEILKDNGISTGFIYLMNEFERYLSEKVETYKQSDKSQGALAELQTKDYEVRDTIYVLSLNEMDLLWTAMNKYFISKIEDDEKGRILSLSLFLIAVVFIGIIGRKFMLKELGERVGKLKNILRVFPAELVLANFALKTFLMKTSQVGFELVRNEV